MAEIEVFQPNLEPPHLTRQGIIDELQHSPIPLSCHTLKQRLQLKEHNVRRQLKKLLAKGKIKEINLGKNYARVYHLLDINTAISSTGTDRC